MAVFNGARFLPEAVESVLGQTFGDFELVVVDDGSCDQSREIVERVAAGDPRVRLIANEVNLGLRVALNLGCKQARAPYIARLDADDVALPGRLGRQVEFLDAHPAVAVVGGALIRIDTAGRRGATMRFPTSNHGIKATLRRHSCLSHTAVAIRRSALEQVGGYRLDHAEDLDLWLRLADRWELANLAEPVALYREHPGQTTFATLEAQSKATLAILAAARARRDGHDDPLDGTHQLAPELFDRLGISLMQIAAQVERDCLERAAGYELLGHHTEASELLVHARRTLGARTERTFAAAVALKRADARLSAGHPSAAAKAFVQALLHAPGYCSGRLAARLRDRVRGRRFS
jgi:hypothetical protein